VIRPTEPLYCQTPAGIGGWRKINAKDPAMDENENREMKDRHSRDEAEMRRSQQLAAGGRHSPVEAYPQHGAEPLDTALARSAGAGQYEISLGKEQLAWQRLKAAPSGSPPGPLWHAWRSAVEERDRATRGLVNQWLESAATEGSPSP
jgi:hypothetical protein